MTHLTEEQLVAFRFGDAEAEELAGIEAHLGGCEACRKVLSEIDVTLSVVARMPVPDRSEGYGAEVWDRIRPRLERSRKPTWMEAVAAFLRPGRLVFAGGMAVLVLAAFVAGRFWPRPQPTTTASAGGSTTAQATPGGATEAGPTQAGSTQASATTEPGTTQAGGHAQVRQNILLVAVGDHLERSQMALLQLVNSTEGAQVDISDERARARDLVVENRLYRQTAEETGDTGMASVLDDLERVLVEIANSPSELTKTDFERVRQRIESQGIIFKVRVFGERVRERETRAGTDI